MIKKDNFKLSIIIPCYNEKNTIESILEKILKSLNDYKIFNYEIIIVDDNSKDGTIKILENLKMMNIFLNLQKKINLKPLQVLMDHLE